MPTFGGRDQSAKANNINDESYLEFEFSAEDGHGKVDNGRVGGEDKLPDNH